jgi:plasmid stabilization system protein ParE
MKKPVEFVSAAQDEYLAALTWYSERSRSAAARFEAEVETALERIQEAPTRWPQYIGCRRFLLHRFPFAVVYEESEFVIRILAVAHLHRKPAYWQHRQ